MLNPVYSDFLPESWLNEQSNAVNGDVYSMFKLFDTLFEPEVDPLGQRVILFLLVSPFMSILLIYLNVSTVRQLSGSYLLQYQEHI